jgi:hypothetical protein
MNKACVWASFSFVTGPKRKDEDFYHHSLPTEMLDRCWATEKLLNGSVKIQILESIKYSSKMVGQVQFESPSSSDRVHALRCSTSSSSDSDARPYAIHSRRMP